MWVGFFVFWGYKYWNGFIEFGSYDDDISYIIILVLEYGMVVYYYIPDVG